MDLILTIIEIALIFSMMMICEARVHLAQKSADKNFRMLRAVLASLEGDQKKKAYDIVKQMTESLE